MDIAQTIERLGGWASWSELRAAHPKRTILRAVASGIIVRKGRGRYVTALAEGQFVAAVACSGVLSHTSAALHHGWSVKTVPDVAQVTIARKRGRGRSAAEGVRLHRADVTPSERAKGVTDPLRTVLDCARHLPFDEALAVADSALRHRTIARSDLIAASAQALGPGARAVRRVATLADGRAANPLESVLRALTIEEGFRLTPQLVVAESGMFGAVDLGSEELRLAVEAEGYQTHGTRKGLRRDCRRHTLFEVFGWDSLRYSYEDVMFDQEWVRWTLRSWRDTREGRLPSDPPRAAA